MSKRKADLDFKAIAARSGMCPASAMIDLEEASDQPRDRLTADPTVHSTASANLRSNVSALRLALLRGQMLECICRGASVGGQSLLECLLRAPWESGVFNALVDTAHGLDPESLYRGNGRGNGRGDVLDEGLLWVPVKGSQPLVRALDILLRDENFGLVAADLRGLPLKQLQAIQPFVWYRLQRLAHQRPGACVLLTESPSVRCADRRVQLDQPRRLADLDVRRVDLLSGIERSVQLRSRGAIIADSNDHSHSDSHSGESMPGHIPMEAVG